MHQRHPAYHLLTPPRPALIAGFRRRSAASLIHLTGRLDLSSAAAVEPCLLAAVAADQRRLVVDLGETTFIDGSGVRALLAGLTAARRAAVLCAWCDPASSRA